MTEAEYDKLDKIVAQTFGRLMTEGYNEQSIVLINFNPKNAAHMAVYHIAGNVCNLIDKPLYIKMPFFKYLAFKWKYRNSKIRCGYAIKPKHQLSCDSLIEEIKQVMPFTVSYFNFMAIYHEFYEVKE